MSHILVAIDLETTGLQTKRDQIIEIGAVKFRVPNRPSDNVVIDRWSTLVNPKRSLPYRIQKLTGIAPHELDNAPPIQQVIGPLVRFVGHLPVVGHNVSFDLGFLRQQNVLLDNAGIDTFEMASIIMPYAAGYGLGRLADQLDISFPTRHRALEDAMMTKDLFLALFQRACQLEMEVIQEINRLVRHSRWPLRTVMRDVEQTKARYAFTQGSIGQQLHAKTKGREQFWGIRLPSQARRPQPLEPSSQEASLDEAMLSAQLESGGSISSHMPDYEQRPQQIYMLRAVTKAFNEHKQLMVEAGTGTGKSLAYLLPSIHYAAANGKHVVISTNTINLQDQLVHKDLPDLRKLTNISFEAMVLKGRTNYLCPRRLDLMRQSANLSPRDMTTLAKILVWARSTTTGDQSELTLIQQRGERAFWYKICVDGDACQPDICHYEQQGRCFFYNARRQAEAAHIIVVNHALLLADMMTANRVLPEYHHLIIDEAHHLEEQATHQLGVVVNQEQMEQFLNEISQARSAGHYSGFLTILLNQVEKSHAPKTAKSQIKDLVNLAQKEITLAGPRLYNFFNALKQFLEDRTPRKGDYDVQIRLVPALRTQPAWEQVERTWDDLRLVLKRISQSLEQIYRPFEKLDDAEIAEHAGLVQTLAGYREHLVEYVYHLENMISKPEPTTIYWVNIKAKNGELGLHTAPLHVGDLLSQGLFDDKDTVVLTSATLQIDGKFSFMQDRLGLEEIETLSVGSPFDYTQATLLYVPTNIPEPNTHGYAQNIHKTLIDLCQATKGRTLVLFTSKSQLNAAYQAISEPLGEQGINVLSQYQDGSRRQLLENFKREGHTVLLGAHSFWEGVDVPGPALSCVVIARLPFSVPSDPVFAARSESYDNPFMQFAVAQTVLRFRQGFGRLNRHRSDRGVVVILDRRVLTKRYGQVFLRSLPACTTRKGPLNDLPEAAARWIELER